MTRYTGAESPSIPRADDWDVRILIRFLVRNWKVLLLAVFLGGGLGYASSYLCTPTYRADATLMVSDELAGSQSASLGGSLGALGALAGLSAGGERSLEALATLKSRALTETFIREENLLPVLFASKWDAEKKGWKPMAPDQVPTEFDGYKLFDKSLRKVTENKKEGTVTISVEWEDKQLATQWTRDFVDRTNAFLRDETIRRSNRNLQYLREELDSTSVVEVRASVYKLIEAEIKKVMLAKGSPEFAFRFIDPPVTPRKKVFPSRALFAVGGAFLASLLVLLRLYWRMPGSTNAFRADAIN